MSRASLWNALTTEFIDKANGSLEQGNPATEQIDGVTARHLIIASKEMPVPDTITDTVVTTEFWIAAQEKPLIVQLKYTFPPDPNSLHPNAYEVIKWSRFNESFDVQPPSGGITPEPYYIHDAAAATPMPTAAG